MGRTVPADARALLQRDAPDRNRRARPRNGDGDILDDYGIGPWDIHEFNAGNAEDLHEHGRPVERSWRLATTMVGRVQWELIEPLDDKSDYARFLAEKGEGVHHIAVAPTNFDQALADLAKKENEVLLSGTFSGIRSRTYRPSGSSE
jgi:hypothetical protein